MMRILESDFVGNLAHGLIRACQQILDTVNDGKVDVFNGGLAGFLLHKVAEIVGGHQFLETSEDIAVDGLAGGKLAVVETEAVAFGIGRFSAIVNASHLSWSHKYQRAFLIIVLAVPVSQLSVYLFFQVDAIETIEFLFMLQNFDLTEVDECHQQVQCFYSQELIVIVDAADIYDVAHILLPPNI